MHFSPPFFGRDLKKKFIPQRPSFPEGELHFVSILSLPSLSGLCPVSLCRVLIFIEGQGYQMQLLLGFCPTPHMNLSATGCGQPDLRHTCLLSVHSAGGMGFHQHPFLCCVWSHAACSHFLMVGEGHRLRAIRQVLFH